MGLNCSMEQAQRVLRKNTNQHPHPTFDGYMLPKALIEWMNNTMSTLLPVEMVARYGLTAIYPWPGEDVFHFYQCAESRLYYEAFMCDERETAVTFARKWFHKTICCSYAQVGLDCVWETLCTRLAPIMYTPGRHKHASKRELENHVTS